MKKLATLAAALMPTACHAASDAFHIAGRFEADPAQGLNAVALYTAAGFFFLAFAQLQAVSKLETRRRKIEEAVSRLFAR